MEHRPRIAVITRNALMNIGLKSILERIIPMAEVTAFTSVAELEADGGEFFHHFVSSQIFIEQSRFFLERRHRTIVLAESASAPQPTAGVSYLNINCSEEELVKSILRLHHAAHNGGYHGACDERSAACRYDGPTLSAREIDVLRLVVRGLLNKEIADRLNIGLTTVISHRRNLVEKLGIRSVSGLTIYAVTHGLVGIDEI